MKRHVLIKGIIILAVLVVAGASMISSCNRQDVLVLTAQSPDGESASVVAFKDSLLGTYAADLIVRAGDGRIIHRANLIRHRDSIEDVKIEFFSLEFKGDVLNLGTRGTHYHGTNQFNFRR